MTPSQLKSHVNATGSHFFDSDSMRHMGDSMRNYGCRAVEIIDHHGATVPARELYRRRPVKDGVQSSAYFHRETFRRVFPVRESANA